MPEEKDKPEASLVGCLIHFTWEFSSFTLPLSARFHLALTFICKPMAELKLSNDEIKRAILTMDEQEDLPKDMLEQVSYQMYVRVEVKTDWQQGLPSSDLS
ncbi:hypothetical protein P7K49_018128 [Saguinus oedipus]|uniref:Uncharacterized protein n=1 Tax=Saguinus oedipus TaxID=9490 RepID=A0ABQ9V784_SAGOE|nr:hypothetical protein P7K49_018128 [Saguinus oedipus]